MKDLSIVIVNWNTKDLIDRCLESIYKYTTGLDYEIIVSDNGSEDGSLDLIRNKYTEVILIENKSNVGFGKANNLAMDYVTGKCILFLNSDTELFDNSISKLYSFLNSKSTMGACGGKLLYPDRTIQLSFGNFPKISRVLWITIAGILHINFNKKPLGVVPYNIIKPIQVDYIVGADLMVKKEVLEKVGLFDENFFAYFEETDLCYRIKKSKYEIWYVPESEIIHVFGGSFKNFSKKKFQIFTESQFKYYKKNLGHYKPLKYYFMLNSLVKMCIYKFTDKKKYIEIKDMYDIIKNVSI